jgi:hypothetical protein
MSLPTEPLQDGTNNPLRFVAANIINPNRYDSNSVAYATAAIPGDRRASLRYDDAVIASQKYYIDEMLYKLNPADSLYQELTNQRGAVESRFNDLITRLTVVRSGGVVYAVPRPELFYSAYYSSSY